MAQKIKPEKIKVKQNKLFKYLIYFLIFLFIGYSILRIVFGFSIQNSILLYPFKKYFCEREGGDYICWKGYDLGLGQSCGCHGPYKYGDPIDMKPVVYLYPQKTIDVVVKINHQTGFSVTYPEYKNGWEVIADSKSKIINKSDGLEYSYLYWEGNPDPNANYDLSTGFIVKGEDTATFLQQKLSEIGLIPKEYNEFIVYWLPQMKSNPYNLIHFASKSEYEDRVKMEINPQPDSVLRILMVYKTLEKSINIKPQTFPKFIRRGFTVVEWGGSKLN